MSVLLDPPGKVVQSGVVLEKKTPSKGRSAHVDYTVHKYQHSKDVNRMMLLIPIFAAAGYSLLYLLLGGGLGGAILIFFIAKMLGK